MWIFLTHHLTFRSPEKKATFLQRIFDHAEQSRSLNYFTATIQDYGIIIKFRQEKIYIRDKFGRENFRIILTIREADEGCVLYVCIKPTQGNIVIKALFALFLLVCPFPLVFVIFLGIIFFFELIALGLKVWWTNDLFKKKLFAMDCSLKGRNP